MKKLIAVFLCISVVLCLFGCKTETNKCVIDLGGSLGKYTLEGKAFGNYKVIDTPKAFIFKESDNDVTVYQDLSCDSPYIVVYRAKKGSDTFESFVKKEADEYADGYYQMFEKDVDVPAAGAYICTYEEIDGVFYYVDSDYFEDGEDIVVVDIYGKTEELKIGDSNVYAYIPVGYTDKLDDDYRNHGSIFCCTYSEDYYYSTTWIGKWENTYEYLNWLWGDYYPNGVPVTEEQYKENLANYAKGEYTMEQYYKDLGSNVVFDSYATEGFDFDYEGGFYVLQSGVEAWFKVNNDWYLAWFQSELNPAPAFAWVFLVSLHTK